MFNVLDLFSGIGGFSYGLESTGGYRTVAFCELDAYARRVLGRHWPDVPVFGDIRHLNAAVLDICGIPAVDVLCGGFPCQDLSLAGRGAGLFDGERSRLWFEYLRLIDETRPAWVIIENVPALRSRGLDTVLRGIASLGYDAEWHCIPAAAVGAPHRRDRVWIIAYDPNPSRPRQSQPIGTGEALFRTGQSQSAGLAGGAASHVPVTSSDRRSEGRSDGDSVHGKSGGEGNREPVGTCAARRDADGPRLAFGQGEPGDARSEFPSLVRTDWWVTEPDVGRVADGVSARVDRLKCLGNAIVPQIAELIGRAILDFECYRRTKSQDMEGDDRSPGPLIAPVVSR